MSDDIRIDSHKLIYHPEAVARWLAGEDIYPIEIEISPSGACNHRCVFCAVDYLGYGADMLRKDAILRDVAFLSKHGSKSVICSGEGEPLLNKDMPDIANEIKSFGTDVAMSTNGALFDRAKLESCLASFTWVRYSIASFDTASYDLIQRGQPGDLEKVKRNLADAVDVKRSRGLSTTIGVQCLLLEENADRLREMASSLREIGVDYFTIKPYSQHLHSKNIQNIDYEKMLVLEEELRALETAEYKIFFRANAMQKMRKKKSYKTCWGLPFMSHIDAKGNVWPCVAHIGQQDLCFGNINDSTFEEIWNGSRRREAVKILNSHDINAFCREACRLDEMNKYLDELKHPGAHVNFI